MSIERIRSDIEIFGWHVVKVLEDENGPGFGYSIGLFQTFSHPEILIVGLRLDLIHLLINNIGADIKKGKIFIEGQFYENVIDNYKCYFLKVNQEYYNDYVGQAQSYYGNAKFPLMQCAYPTLENIYPWQKDWPDSIKDLQPILGESPKSN